MGDHFHRAVDLSNAPFRRVGFVRSQTALAAENLAIQVVLLEGVTIDQDQAPDARSRERLGHVSTQPTETWDFEEVVAKADKLGKMAKEAAEESVKISQQMITRAEEISQQATEAAEAAARASQEAINKAVPSRPSFASGAGEFDQ